METTGERVKRLRKSMKWTQKDLTVRLAEERIKMLLAKGYVEEANSIDHNTASMTVVSRIESGATKEMKLTMAEMLANIFDTSPDYILYGDSLERLYPRDVYRFLMNEANVDRVKKFVYGILGNEM